MDDTQSTLLVAESDEPLLEFLVEQFLADRFEAGGARTAEETRVKLAQRHPDLLVLGELGQPHAALALLRRIRSHGFDGLRVIVVGADGSDLAQLRAFREGCDDYLAKESLSYPLLLARARALLRRANGGIVARRRIGALEIDTRARGEGCEPPAAVRADGVRAALTLGRRANASLDQGAAAPSGVGLQGHGQHPHRRRPRQPAAQQARAGGSAVPGRQRPRRRVPAVRRPGGGRAQHGGLGISRERPCGVTGRHRAARRRRELRGLPRAGGNASRRVGGREPAR